MKISGIYKIQSKIKPDRIYIGSAINIRHRWNQHLFDLRLNKHHSQKLQRHFNKYTESDLIFIIIELCFPEFLTAREQYYLDKLKPWFNICKIAGNSLGIKRSEEFKSKISAANKGHNHSEEVKRKISEAGKGRAHSDDARQKISEAQKGRKASQETRQKLSESHKGKIPWNKGMKGLQVAWNKGISPSPESIEKWKITMRNKKLKTA